MNDRYQDLEKEAAADRRKASDISADLEKIYDDLGIINGSKVIPELQAQRGGIDATKLRAHLSLKLINYITQRERYAYEDGWQGRTRKSHAS